MRTISIDGFDYLYRIGAGNTVIKPPSGKKVVVANHILKGLINPDDFDKGKYKKTSDGMITPSDIKSHIIEMEII